jgi:hypothetical protein
MRLMSNDPRPDPDPDPGPAAADFEEEALLQARAAGDTGRRTDLDEVIRALGFDRDELERERVAEEGYIAVPPGRAMPVPGHPSVPPLDDWNF